MTGGGGEAGPASRCPEAQVSTFLVHVQMAALNVHAGSHEGRDAFGLSEASQQACLLPHGMVETPHGIDFFSAGSRTVLHACS